MDRDFLKIRYSKLYPLIGDFNLFTFNVINDIVQLYLLSWYLGFPHSSVSKESACSAGDLGLIPGWEDPLEKEMETHSSILAWRIPWTEEPGGLQSLVLQESNVTSD